MLLPLVKLPPGDWRNDSDKAHEASSCAEAWYVPGSIFRRPQKYPVERRAISKSVHQRNGNCSLLRGSIDDVGNPHQYQG